MVVLNDLDRFHLVGDVVDRVPSLGSRVAYVSQLIRDKLIDHKKYIHEYGQDMPEIREWQWCPTSPANVDPQLRRRLRSRDTNGSNRRRTKRPSKRRQ
jgi:hypothetical protein